MPGLSCSLDFDEFSAKYEEDERFTSLAEVKEREKLFNARHAIVSLVHYYAPSVLRGWVCPSGRGAMARRVRVQLSWMVFNRSAIFPQLYCLRMKEVKEVITQERLPMKEQYRELLKKHGMTKDMTFPKVAAKSHRCAGTHASHLQTPARLSVKQPVGDPAPSNRSRSKKRDLNPASLTSGGYSMAGGWGVLFAKGPTPLSRCWYRPLSVLSTSEIQCGLVGSGGRGSIPRTGDFSPPPCCGL